MSLLPVVCGVLIDGARVLMTRRGLGLSDAGMWEFPGGAVERNETPAAALARELLEELSINAAIGELIAVGADARIALTAFAVRSWKGEIRLIEHDAMRWLGRLELAALPMRAPDRQICDAMLSRCL